MILITIICFFVFVGLPCVIFSLEKKKKEETQILAREKAYSDKYGCSMDEMRERIKNSPSIKAIASRVKELPQPPSEIEVRPEGLLYADNARTILFFSSLGLSDIPYGCTGVLCEGLAKELQSFAPYKYIQKDCHDYLVVDRPQKHGVKGW